jgi:hypothetical protein
MNEKELEALRETAIDAVQAYLDAIIQGGGATGKLETAATPNTRALARETVKPPCVVLCEQLHPPGSVALTNCLKGCDD